MEIVILLVPLAFLLVGLAIWAFVWALRRGQFDDLDSPQWRILFDDQQPRGPHESKSRESDVPATTDRREETPRDPH